MIMEIALAAAIESAPACQHQFDDLVEAFGEKAIVLNKEDVPFGYTRGFIAETEEGAVLLGLEQDGCTKPPIVLQPAPERSRA